MRYWLLLDDEPAGPYATEDLGDIPGFSRGALVYPEKRLDPRDERWLRAGDVPQLAVALARSERRAFAGRYIVPEPTVRDLPVLGAILRQIERFEEDLLSLRANLTARHQELASLRGDAESAQTQLDALAEELRAGAAALEARVRKLEPLEADVHRLREASLEAAQASMRVEERLSHRVDELLKRLESLENDIDHEAQAEMMRAYTASLQERIEGLDRNLAKEHGDVEALRKILKALESRLANERAARGFLAGGGLFSKPEKLVLAGFLLLLALIGGLFYLVLKRAPAPSAAPSPAPDPEPVVERETVPSPEPVILKPKEQKPRRRRRSSNKRAAEKTAAQAAREKKIRETILFRVTGGVPSSKRVVAPERKAEPLPAPEEAKN
jgi:hypothetical protein